MSNPAEDPFEAFRKKKEDQDQKKALDDEDAKRQAEEERVAAEQMALLEAEAEGDDSEEEGDGPKKRPLIMTRMLRKSAKKGEVADTNKPSGFDDHRFSGTKPGDEIDESDEPEGMQKGFD